MGGIEITRIKKILRSNIKYGLKKKKIASPGQEKVHYSPGIPIRLNATKAFSATCLNDRSRSQTILNLILETSILIIRHHLNADLGQLLVEK